MAEFKDVADKASSVQERKSHRSMFIDNQNKLLPNVSENFGEKEMIPTKHNINQNTPQKGAESDRSVLTNVQEDLLSGSSQIRKESGENNDDDAVKSLKEHNKLCKVMCCIHQTIINLLRQKMKLIHIKNENFQNHVIISANDVQQKVKETLEAFFTASGILKNVLFQEIWNVIESATNEQTVNEINTDLDQIEEETQGLFLDYQVVYKKCKSVLEAYFLQNIDSKLKIKLTSKSSLEPQSAYSSLLEDVFSHKSCLDSSEKAYEECEHLINHVMKNTSQNAEDRIELLFAVINTAEFSCNELKSFATVLLNFQYAEI